MQNRHHPRGIHVPFVGLVAAAIMVSASSVVSQQPPTAPEVDPATAPLTAFHAPTTTSGSTGASLTPTSSVKGVTGVPTPVVGPTISTTIGTIVPARAGALARAIANARSGAVLTLRGGNHVVSRMIVTSKRLTIQNYPGEHPVITDAGGRPDLLYIEGGPVTLRGLTFRTSSRSRTYNDSMGSALVELRGRAHDVLITRCVFIGSPAMSYRQQLLYISGKSATIRRVRILSTTLKANGTQGYGIHMYDERSSGWSVDYLSISGLRAYNFYRNAAVVFWSRSNHVVLSSSSFYRGKAVRYYRGLGVTVANNRGHLLRVGLQIDNRPGLVQRRNYWGI